MVYGKSNEFLGIFGIDFFLDKLIGVLGESKIESGRMALNEDRFSFREFLDQINVIVGGQCREKGLQYECNLTEPIDAFFIGDSLKLRQVIIALTANAFEDDVQKCLEAGMDAHLPKPVDFELLKQTLSKLLSGR